MKREKRTNLMLNADALDVLVSLAQEKTYSAAVQMAIDHFIRAHKSQKILKYMGKNVWSGRLSEMREDKNI
jgi:hypothetical protein